MDSPKLVGVPRDEPGDGALETLQWLANHGPLAPRMSRSAPLGYSYPDVDEAIDPATLARDLETLHGRHYVERRLVERLTRCGTCRDVHLNFREICPACASIDFVEAELLHHYRCGYVARASEFPIDGRGRRCPKCQGRFQDRGTDHDSPGPHFLCGACRLPFQTPQIGSVCLGCGEKASGDELERLGTIDVFSWNVSPLGREVLAGAAPAAAQDSIFAEDGILYRRALFLTYVEDELRRRREFHTTFAALAITFPETSSRNEQIATLRALLRRLSDTAKAARIDAYTIALLLPETSAGRARDTIRFISKEFHLPATLRTPGDRLAPDADALETLAPLSAVHPGE